MKKIRIIRNVPADAKSGSVAYSEGQTVTIDDAAADKLLKRARPLAVLVEEIKPHKPVELAASIKSATPSEKAFESSEAMHSALKRGEITEDQHEAATAKAAKPVEPAKPQAKPSKQ
jgi:hypothetical protein